MNQRQTYLVGLMLFMLLFAAWWSVSWMFEQQATATRSANSLAESRALLERIAALREKPAVAAAEGMDNAEIAKMVQQARVKARIPADPVDNYIYRSQRQIGNAPYAEKPTTLVMPNITLPQLAALLFHLTDNTGLRVRDIALRSPTGDDAAGDTWNAEATITYLIYAPLDGNDSP